MPWNWELPDWPHFTYILDAILLKERQFLMAIGQSQALLKGVEREDFYQFIIEILSEEGLESARIEGEILDRQSLQSSIKKHFGLKSTPAQTAKEKGMAEILCSVYETFQEPLSHQMLWKWHEALFNFPTPIEKGRYRTHTEPMQIISNYYGSTKVFFEAPPSKYIFQEMEQFLEWFNAKNTCLLGKAAIAHVYFESLHPFEDGNGRIGRLIIEKVLSQGVGRPTLIALSKTLEDQKKEYYAALEKCNRTLQVTDWVEFFADAVLQAQEDSMKLLYFLIQKSQLMNHLKGQINSRQEKALLRLFAEGLKGFKGGLSAENYIAITKASRATATRDLADLVAKGALIKTGELRHTRYWIKKGDF